MNGTNVSRVVALVLLISAGHASASPRAAAPAGPIALAAPKDFAAAVAAIERATGAKGTPFEIGKIRFGEGEARSFAVDGRTAERLLAGTHATFRHAGFYLFRYERSFGVAGEKDQLALVATRDRDALLRHIGTGNAKAGLTTERIIGWLAALAKEEPFHLTEIGVDYVAGRFERSPTDPPAIAKRCAEFAPDLVAGRASTLELLTEEIRVNRTLYLIF